MFYAKNVPAFEWILRVMMGLAMIAAGLMMFGGQAIGYVLVAGGAMAALTGFVGFCPMCAMVGRKLDSKQG